MTLLELLELIWQAVLALFGLGVALIALFVIVVVVIVAAKTIKKEVQEDDRTE